MMVLRARRRRWERSSRPTPWPSGLLAYSEGTGRVGAGPAAERARGPRAGPCRRGCATGASCRIGCTNVLRFGHPGLDPAQYVRAHVQVKEFGGYGWVCVRATAGQHEAGRGSNVRAAVVAECVRPESDASHPARSPGCCRRPGRQRRPQCRPAPVGRPLALLVTAPYKAALRLDGDGTQRADYGVNVGHDVHGDIHVHPAAPAAGPYRFRTETASPISVHRHAACGRRRLPLCVLASELPRRCRTSA